MATYKPQSVLAHQPVSLVFKLYCIAHILVRLPLWVIKYALLRSSRPHPKWTLRQSVMLRLTRSVVDMNSQAETPKGLSLHPGKEKDRFRVAAPAAETYYTGPLAASAGVAPAPVGVTWYPRMQAPNDEHSRAIVVLHLHGGAFVMGTGRDEHMDHMAAALLEHGDVSGVFAPAYRLACRPDPTPFPGALQDALTSYLFLVRDLGVPPECITLSGDSAGGNLVVALLRYIADFGDALGIPRPRNAAVVAPWVNPAGCLGPDVCFTSNPHYASDYLPPSFLRWGAAAYTGGGSDAAAAAAAARDPYISPLGHPFAAGVPLLVSLGEVELLEADGARWAREMRDAGNDVDVYCERDAPHDTLLIGASLGWTESAQGVAARVGAFTRKKVRDD